MSDPSTTEFAHVSSGLHYDYYWRDYTGDIPRDAVPGGRDVNHRPTYIGHVYVHKYGICTVTIYPGITTVVPSVTGYYIFDHIKILCSPFKEKFRWVATDAEKLHVQLIGKHLVRGGVDYNGKTTNIGRILHKGEIIVAKVCGSVIGNAKLYYCDNNSEKSVNSYEVLIYDLN
ncbi:uncharacterized protein LOC108910566 [Anoplophora glabripennis]|uniref:uncharacterized protein LOC108910566 n=1 Tax=Anoplophora glabripennis TaxID=217634 RepID=UPI000875338F|nr:uncharacterized protein LOC108910566 [Anoplophora glabripennis]